MTYLYANLGSTKQTLLKALSSVDLNSTYSITGQISPYCGPQPDVRVLNNTLPSTEYDVRIVLNLRIKVLGLLQVRQETACMKDSRGDHRARGSQDASMIAIA